MALTDPFVDVMRANDESPRDKAYRQLREAAALVATILDGTYQEQPGQDLPWADRAFQQAILKALGTAAHWKRSHDSLSHLGTVLRGNK